MLASLPKLKVINSNTAEERPQEGEWKTVSTNSHFKAYAANLKVLQHFPYTHKKLNTYALSEREVTFFVFH